MKVKSLGVVYVVYDSVTIQEVHVALAIGRDPVHGRVKALRVLGYGRSRDLAAADARENFSRAVRHIRQRPPSSNA